MGLVLLHKNLVYISTYPSCYQPCHWCVKWIVPPWWVTSLLQFITSSFQMEILPRKSGAANSNITFTDKNSDKTLQWFLISKILLKYSIKAKLNFAINIFSVTFNTHELGDELALYRISSFPTLEGANGGDLIPSYTRFQCNRTRPIYTTTHITDVATSCFPCCSYFLFELMYIHPVWSVSAFSCLRRCSIVLLLCVVGTSCTSSWTVF